MSNFIKKKGEEKIRGRERVQLQEWSSQGGIKRKRGKRDKRRD